ncbi:MAG TPA: alpha/beta hydrolase [Vicinamibacterales bacterium]|jgi:pimeloyl-ACP methyl ester carboxylesterase
MNIVDRGSGIPVVVVPGVQGRWEWMEPGIDALAQRGRVVTFSLADEPSSGTRFDEALGFWNYVDQARDALSACGLDRAAICGVSFGGLIAAAFAARYPARVSSLILVSALPPSWRPDARASFYLRHPWLLTPLFCAGAIGFCGEIAAANDTWWSGITAACGAGINVLRHMFHPGRMARRVHHLTSVRIDTELTRVKVPVLVVTGEESLERVVPPRLTREYAAIWPHARVETLRRTGHLGMITRPHEFAAIVSRFVAESEQKIA